MKKYLFIIVLACIAIVNAAYLSLKAYEISQGVDPSATISLLTAVCDINDTFSCTDALADPLSRPFGIPFPYIALVVYPVLLIIALVGYLKRSYTYAKALAVLSFLGICFNGYIITMETFYIRAYCPLCLFCSAIIITIFITSLLILRD